MLILVKVLSVIMFFLRIHLKYKASEGGKAKVGRPSLNEVWVDLGVSRRTYFRMKSKLKVSGWDQPATNFVIQQ